MITREYFNRELDRLYTQFNANSFSKEKLILIYKAIIDLENYELNDIVDDIIGNCRGAPTVNDFKERSYKYARNKKLEVVENGIHCNRCNNNGYIYSFKDNASYIFRCNCCKGKSLNLAWPIWENNYFDLGFKVKKDITINAPF